MGKCYHCMWPALYKDRHEGLSVHPPLLLGSLLQAEPVSSEYLLHVVITALWCLKNLFLSVPLLNQFRPICGFVFFFPQDKTAASIDTALRKSLPTVGAAKQPCLSGWSKTQLSLRPISMASVVAAAAALQVKAQWYHVTSEFKVSGICMPLKTMTLMLLELISPLCPFIVGNKSQRKTQALPFYVTSRHPLWLDLGLLSKCGLLALPVLHRFPHHTLF